MAKKSNRTWSTSSEAISICAEHPTASAQDLYCALFNASPSDYRAAIGALAAGIEARKRADLQRLQDDLKALEARKIAEARKA